MTKIAGSQAKLAISGLHFLGSHGELRFSSCSVICLLTWPADQPRHATRRFSLPDRNAAAAGWRTAPRAGCPIPQSRSWTARNKTPPLPAQSIANTINARRNLGTNLERLKVKASCMDLHSFDTPLNYPRASAEITLCRPIVAIKVHRAWRHLADGNYLPVPNAIVVESWF